jgi:RimJ/RimL family protein N-acetyltransferase
MPFADFAAYHQAGLMKDEVRHNLMLAILSGYLESGSSDILTWALGAPGQCAIKTPGRSIILGDLRQPQCHQLAEDTRELAYPGVLGPGETANWFVDRAVQLGIRFGETVDQQIHALADPPRYPGAPGSARQATAGDAPLLAEWIIAFHEEAVPHDPLPSREELLRRADPGAHWFWEVEGEPVSMAAIARRTHHIGAIAPVYTPPAHRGRGYAGSVTAAVVEAIFAEGRQAACLYINLANPFSGRCYAKIGFTPVCAFPHFLRESA